MADFYIDPDDTTPPASTPAPNTPPDPNDNTSPADLSGEWEADATAPSSGPNGPDHIVGNCLVNQFPTRCGLYAPPCPTNAYTFSSIGNDTPISATQFNQVRAAIRDERERRMDISPGSASEVFNGLEIEADQWTDVLTDIDEATYTTEGIIFASDSPDGKDPRQPAKSYLYTHDEFGWGEAPCPTHGGESGTAEGHDGWPIGISAGNIIMRTHIDKMRKLVNHLRTDCICHSDCSYYDACSCHNNCGCNYSDVNVKDYINEFNGREIVDNISPSSWKYKKEIGQMNGVDDGTHFSLMAQDIKQTLENAGYTDQKIVQENSEGILVVEKPYELISFLWDNVKQLNSDIDSIKSKLNI